MRLFCYYALNTFVNQLKKLFKTWVLIFLLVCMVIGGLIGAGAAKLSDMSEPEEPENTVTEPGDIPLPNWDELPEDPGEEISDEPDERMGHIVELIAGGVILAVLVYEALGADKNGSRIFQPADVNLLFSAPMRPQSVLMFRLTTQLGMAILASVYLLFQLPNLTLNLGLGLWPALAIIGTWCFTIALGKLVQTLLYLLCSNHPGAKAIMRRAVYALLALVGAAFFYFWKSSGRGVFDAAAAFFNAPATRYIPVWGWLKGITAFALEGSLTGALACIAACLLAMAALLFVIRRMKADFYEDAMAKSEETAELLEKARSEKNAGLFVTRRKKDRSDSLRRDGLNRGAGAAMFFHKALYNRFRFAHLGFFTKTGELYLVAAVGMALASKYFFHTRSLIPTAAVLTVFVFYRTLGNPLLQDTQADLFRMVPESTWSKLFFSLLGGTANCLLDVLPALIAAVILLPGDVLTALGWLVLIATMDFYASNVSAFIHLSVPAATGKTVKQLVQVLFLYFGLLPDVAIMAVALVLDAPAAGVGLCAALNAGLGFLFLALSPLFLTPGAGRSVPAAAAGEGVIRQARRVFSRLGCSAAMILLVASVLQIALVALVNAVAPEFYSLGWAAWVLSFAPLYLVAVPVGLLIARKAPALPPEGEGMTAGRYVGILFISVFLLTAGNLVGVLAQMLLSGLTGTLPTNPIESFAMDDSLFLRILFMVILAPLIEEFIFRKTLIDRMRPYGEKLAVVTSALMFGLFHGNLSQMFYAFTLGLVLGYVYQRTGKLRYSVGIHMLVNFFGGVVSTELARRAMPALEGLEDFSGSLDLSNMADVAEMLEHVDLSSLLSPWLIGLGLYEILSLVCAVVGLVLLIVRSRRVTFRPMPQELPRSAHFRTAWLNPGMLVFVAVCLLSVVFTFISL